MNPDNPQYRFAKDSVPAIETSYTFKSLPLKDQIEKFEYVNFDYIADQPGYVGNNEFKSYVGKYWDYKGTITQE